MPCRRCISSGRNLAPSGTRRRAGSGVVVALEFALDACEMPVHRRPCGFGIATGDRRENGRMVAQRLLGELSRMEVLLGAPPHLGALVPQLGDDELERPVAGRFGETHMEVAVGGLARREVLELRFHLL